MCVCACYHIHSHNLLLDRSKVYTRRLSNTDTFTYTTHTLLKKTESEKMMAKVNCEWVGYIAVSSSSRFRPNPTLIIINPIFLGDTSFFLLVVIGSISASTTHSSSSSSSSAYFFNFTNITIFLSSQSLHSCKKYLLHTICVYVCDGHA